MSDRSAFYFSVHTFLLLLIAMPALRFNHAIHSTLIIDAVKHHLCFIRFVFILFTCAHNFPFLLRLLFMRRTRGNFRRMMQKNEIDFSTWEIFKWLLRIDVARCEWNSNLPLRNLSPLFVLMANRPIVKLFLTLCMIAVAHFRDTSIPLIAVQYLISFLFFAMLFDTLIYLANRQETKN